MSPRRHRWTYNVRLTSPTSSIGSTNCLIGRQAHRRGGPYDTLWTGRQASNGDLKRQCQESYISRSRSLIFSAKLVDTAQLCLPDQLLKHPVVSDRLASKSRAQPRSLADWVDARIMERDKFRYRFREEAAEELDKAVLCFQPVHYWFCGECQGFDSMEGMTRSKQGHGFEAVSILGDAPRPPRRALQALRTRDLTI